MRSKSNCSAGIPLDWIWLKLIGAAGIRKAIRVLNPELREGRWKSDAGNMYSTKGFASPKAAAFLPLVVRSVIQLLYMTIPIVAGRTARCLLSWPYEQAQNI